jgi:hypothetical protein
MRQPGSVKQSPGAGSGSFSNWFLLNLRSIITQAQDSNPLGALALRKTTAEAMTLMMQRNQEEHDADEEQHVVMRAASGDLAHLSRDGGGHGADGANKALNPQARRGIAGDHHHGHGLADGPPDAQHHGGEHT